MYTDEQLIDYIRFYKYGDKGESIIIKIVENTFRIISKLDSNGNYINLFYSEGDFEYQCDFYIDDINFFLLNQRIEKINKIKQCIRMNN